MPIWPLPRITFRELNLVEEKRPVALLAAQGDWESPLVTSALPVVIQAEPTGYSRARLENLAETMPSAVKVVYAIGQGAPVMAGKVIAARRGVPLVIVPTALDSDWMLTPFARLDDQGDDSSSRFVWEETGPASEVIVDWSVLQAAPAERRAGGIVDVLSVVTGLLDWRYAAQHGRNPREQRFETWAAALAAALAKEAIKAAPVIGQGDQAGLTLLLNFMMSAVQLTNQLGHTRAQHGAEHYLADKLAAQTGDEIPHSAVVGPCLLLISALHGQAPTALRTALQQAGVPLDALRPADVQIVINDLPALLAIDQPPHSILNDIEPGSAAVNAALQAAGLAMPEETWQLSDSQLMQVVQAEQLPLEQPTEQAPVVPRQDVYDTGAANAAGSAGAPRPATPFGSADTAGSSAGM